MKHLLILSSCLGALGGCNQLQPQQTVANSMQVEVAQEALPLYETRVLTSSGYANISAQLSDNPSQRRLMAIRASKIDAYRNLTEQVYGQNINATTTLQEAVTSHDAIRAQVEGLVYGARLVSITPIGSDSYETRLEIEQSAVDEIRQRYLFIN